MTVWVSRSVDAFFARTGFSWLAAPVLVALILLNVGCYRDVPAAPDRAVRMLTNLLGDSEASVRRTAAEALGKIGAAQSEQALVQALGDSAPEVREAAGRALGQLPAMGMETATILTSLLRDSDPSVRHVAAQALGVIDNAAELAPRIADFLRDRRVEVRRSSGHALLLMDTPGTIVNQALVEAMHDPDALVRQWAVAALGESGAAESTPVLMDRLVHDVSEAVRAEAAYRLRYAKETLIEKELEASGARDKSANVARWARHSVASLRTETGCGSVPQPSPPAEPVRSH